MSEKKQPQIREAALKHLYLRHAGEVTMSSKRQITIPAAVVRELELEPGMKLAVYVEGEEITLIPRKMNWFEYITTRKPSGIYGTTKEEVDAYLREERRGWDERARRLEGDAYIEPPDD
jgi:AbrB family looped-hinge helix DNA binding protein